MYVDPSRIQMALRFASLAELPAETRAAHNVDAADFVAAAWADATPVARTRYKAALATMPMPPLWAALTKPPALAAAMQGGKLGAVTPTLRGPAVVLLILGQKDPEDEGVANYRLIAGDRRAEMIVEALYRWDVPLLTRTATPSGWNLAAADQPVDDKEPTEAPDVDAEPEPEPESLGDSVPGSSGGLSRTQKQLAAAGIAAGFAALGLAAWRLG